MKLQISLVYKFFKKLMLLRKHESSLEKKISFTERSFPSMSKSSKKGKICKTKVVIQNSATKCHHEFHLRSSLALLTRVILEWPYIRLKVQFRGRKKFMNGNNILLWVMWFVECLFHLISHHPVKFLSIWNWRYVFLFLMRLLIIMCSKNHITLYMVIQYHKPFNLLSLVVMMLFVTWLICHVTIVDGDPFS